MVYSFNNPLIGFKRDFRLFRRGYLMALDKRGFLQLQIVRKNHEPLQIDHILDIISEQGPQGFRILVSLVIIPKEHSGIPVKAIQFPTINSSFPFTSLETSSITKTSQQISQIDVDVVQFDS